MPAERIGGLFDPKEVAALKAQRPVGPTNTPMAEGRIAARVFDLFDKGNELREIVEELEIAPSLVRDLWHEWLIDLGEGEQSRQKSAQEERRRRIEEEQLRELDRRSQQDRQNFEKMMAAITAASGHRGCR